jgi:opacity protein-like surface antigen
MRKLLLLTTALTALAMPAMAADMPVKAPPAVAQPIYPYTVPGIYWGVTTYASQTNLNVNAPGSNAGDMSVIGGSLGVVAGYSMPVNNGKNFARFEVSAAGQNINGTASQSAGLLSIKGPWRIEGVAEYGMPCANIAAYFPNLGGILPTLPAIPSGLVATNCHAYAGLGAAAEDISAKLNMNGGAGVSQGSAWSGALIGKMGQIWQLTNGAAVETWLEYEGGGRTFDVNMGAPKFTPSVQGQDHKIIAGINFLL